MSEITIVGHFGSRYSYATVGSRVARALRDEGMLAACINLDDVWAEDHADLSKQEPVLGKRVLLFTDIRKHVFDTWATQLGAANVAIFSSPNTNLLSKERADACSRAGLVLVPSLWCADTVTRSMVEYQKVQDGKIACVPLGVDKCLLTPRVRTRVGPPKEYLHFSTDFMWPSRKGTDVLLRAWAQVHQDLSLADGTPARLTVHVPMAIYEDVHRVVSDIDLHSSVRIVMASDRGSTDEDLARLYAEADVVVQPSRCEGFGMMMLGALVSGTPLVTTPGTGQADFLGSAGGWLGIALGTCTDEMDGEDGEAPVVTEKAVEDALVAVSSVRMYQRLVDGCQAEAAALALMDASVPWTWEWALEEWVAVLKEWVES